MIIIVVVLIIVIIMIIIIIITKIIIIIITTIIMLTFPAHDELGMCRQVLSLWSSLSCASLCALAMQQV